ncbi:MAG: Aspartyl/asparaginyl beta-hydroxylase [Verrucomicrobiaceae bacterium]|nr:Aspartyl/asparaginyl beta-hydroxylase [Verrucomicrobiaceae bacterium]
MFSAARLPLQYDPARLREDYARIGAAEWVAHFNTKYFQGNWSGVSLHGQKDKANALLVNSESFDYDCNGLKGRCPHLHSVITSFQCPLRAVRLLKLTAGSIIPEHRDYDLGYDQGEVRIHVPVITNPQVEFYLDNKRIIMNPGECWYLDLNRPQRVYNRGSTDRIHLVIDCVLNDWLRELIAQGIPYEGKESSFEDFRLRVLADPALQQQLMGIDSRQELVTKAAELGHTLGYDFLLPDVEAAMRIARESLQKRIA